MNTPYKTRHLALGAIAALTLYATPAKAYDTFIGTADSSELAVIARVKVARQEESLADVLIQNAELDKVYSRADRDRVLNVLRRANARLQEANAISNSDRYELDQNHQRELKATPYGILSPMKDLRALHPGVRVERNFNYVVDMALAGVILGGFGAAIAIRPGRKKKGPIIL